MPNDSEIHTYIKCPGCNLQLPEENTREQVDHMTTNHPDIIEQRHRESRIISKRVAADNYINLLVNTRDTYVVEALTHEHASCACIYRPGVYPVKTLCEVIIDTNDNTLPKCPKCLERFGKHPCVLCPSDCKTC